MPDPFNLARFIEAQRGVYETALAELRAGAKRSHWIWFIFPQIKGLGSSSTAQHFALSGLAEARAYVAHPTLSGRLLACTEAVTALPGTPTAHAIFSSPDDLKFRSSMTLFREAAEDPAPFQAALDRFFGGDPDPRTLDALLSEMPSPPPSDAVRRS
ncbi:DUF1810 domain-containing protein [Rhizobium sp. YIM 134829]|uniref:DUF1810 domain-containing protein n=1 Tax=Rhizobium sp. YIM 134829 TaxID=3390453 RepID=UPI00397802AD